MTMSPSPPSIPANLHGLDVAEVFRRLAAGATLEDLLRESPGLSLDKLRACFAYVAEVLGTLDPPAKNETVEWIAVNAAEPATLAPPATDEAATLPPTECATALTTAKRISLPGYEILGKLGEGGMGVVYKARHLRLNRIVAIKMILAGEHASEAMIARFALEAEAVAQLQHPGIVQIHEIGEHDGHSFLALEYVAGGSLAARLDDKPWPAEKAAELVETLARAMQVAHDHGIVHRDLKPENVLLAEIPAEADGQLTPKITDFGLAKRLQDTTGRTRTGEIMGTPSYMAPEQAAGSKNIGPAADVYALGAILYRLLTGRPPFQADTSLDTLMLVLEQEPVPLHTLNKTLPRDLETIALKCLAKEPAKRYASAAELADDLRRFLDGEPIKARRLSARQRLFHWCRKHPGVAFARGTLVLLLLVILNFFFLAQGLVALAWLLSTLLYFGAVTRTRLRPFLIGLSISLLLTFISLTCITMQLSWLRVLDTGQWWTPNVIFPALNAENLAIDVCLLPMLIGLIRSLFSNLRWQILGYLLVLVLLVSSLHWHQLGKFLLSVIVPALYFGFVCRFVRWWNDGNLIDTFVGSLGGTIIGLYLGFLGFGILRATLLRSNDNNFDSGTVSSNLLVLSILGSMIGSFVGAYLGAISGKRAMRRGHA